jgi:hypothetical protein
MTHHLASSHFHLVIGDGNLPRAAPELFDLSRHGLLRGRGAYDVAALREAAAREFARVARTASARVRGPGHGVRQSAST